MRILIVEDDLDASRLLSKYLEPIGECEVVPNGQEAINVFRKSFREGYPFDLICLDIMMPKMNGHETLKKIRHIEKEEKVQIGAGAKIIMVSSLSDGDTILKSFLELCDGYVVKPVEKKSIYDKLREIDLICDSEEEEISKAGGD